MQLTHQSFQPQTLTVSCCLQAWVPEDEVMLVHSFGLGWDEVTASNLLAVDKVQNSDTTARLTSELRLGQDSVCTMALLTMHEPCMSTCWPWASTDL